jgi:RHS repeat-associated protein
MTSVSGPGNASNTVAGPPSISLLAASLKYNVDLIFEYVYNIEYHPIWADQKGAFGCLVDGISGPFDQCSLLIALLTVPGASYTASVTSGTFTMTPSFVVGTIQLTAAQVGNWLGVAYDSSGVSPTFANTIVYAQELLTNGGFTNVAQPDPQHVQLSHVWVGVTIGGMNYILDPSYKNYVINPGIGLSTLGATAMAYNQTSFLSATAGAMEGATLSSSPPYVQAINRVNVRNDLLTYSTNVVNYIQNTYNTNPSNSAATLDDILGGKTITPRSGSFYWTSAPTIPYIIVGSSTSYTSIPTTLKTTISFQWVPGSGPGGFTYSPYSSDIYGQRLTFFPNSYTPTNWNLQLNGGTALYSPPSIGGQFNITVTHPYLSPITFSQGINSLNYINDPFYYLLSTSIGPTTKGMADYWQSVYAQNSATDSTVTDEPVLGPLLAYIASTRDAALTSVRDILNRLSNCQTPFHFEIGTTAWEYHLVSGVGSGTGKFGFDVQGAQWLATSLDGTAANALACSIAQAMHGYALEAFACAVTVIDTANNTPPPPAPPPTGTPIYMFNYTNYTDMYFPEGVAYTELPYSQIISTQLNEDLDTLLMPQGADPPVPFGWVAINASGFGGAFGSYFQAQGGGTGRVGPPTPTPKKKKKKCPDDQSDPIDMQTGDMTLSPPSDISIGSQSFPYSLSFSRSYDSSKRFVNGPLGLGWTHNFALSMIHGNDAFQSLGLDNAIAGAPSIVDCYVILDLLKISPTLAVQNLVIEHVVLQWWTDQSTNNSAVLSGPCHDLVFTKSATIDGATTISYVSPPEYALALTQNVSTGVFTLTSPQQDVRTFNSSGQITQWAFPNGVTISYTYSSGLLSMVSNGMGRTLSFTYSGTLLQSVSDGTGRSVSFGYSATGPTVLLQFNDLLGNATTYAYDNTWLTTNKAAMLTQFFLPQNPSNAVCTNTFDTLGRVASQKNIFNNTWTIYVAGWRSEIDDPNGFSIVSYYDTSGDVLQHVDQLGNITSFIYDGLGRTIQQTMPEGQTATPGNFTQWTYDNNNNVLSVKITPKNGSPLLPITNTFTYDPTYNKVHTAVDGLGQTTTYNYDPATGNLLNIQRPTVGGLVPQTSFTYNTRGQTLQVTEKINTIAGITTNMVTQYNYDTSTEKLLSTVVDYGTGSHLNLTTQYGYDSVGNANSVTDPNNNTTTALFDNARRLTQVTAPSPFGYVTTYGYDENNNKTSIQKQTGGTPAEQTYSIAYTLSNKLHTVTDPALHVTTKTYDNLDRLWTVTDAQSRVTTFAYDARSNLYTVTDATSVISETRLYTNNGPLASIKDASGNLTQYTYDGFDRSDKTIYADSTFEENSSYDANSNVLTHTTRSTNAITMTYDPLNRLSTKAPYSQPTVTYSYDLIGRVLTESTPVVTGDPASGTFTFVYDSAERLNQEITPDSKTTQYGLDANGNLTTLTYPNDTSGNYFVTRAYDQLNRLTNINLNGATSPAVTIAYDELSRRSQMTFSNGVTISYEFQLNNDLSVLGATFVGSSVGFAYAYNNVHQETNRSISDGTYVWHPSSGGPAIPYGAATSVNEYPSVNSVGYTYDGNANLKTTGTWTYGYDTENHLLTASEGGTSPVSASFVYDPMHRQIEKTVTTTGGTTLSRYVYSGFQRIADYNGTSGALQNRYVYGAGLDEPLIVVSPSLVLTYLHADRSGSIITTTNSSGTVTNKNNYSPFGENAAFTGTTFGFTGQRYDSETGLYYYKARYYSPTIGRFLQPDPVGYTKLPCTCRCEEIECDGTGALQLNLYAYVGSDPLNWKDPLGLLTKNDQVNCLGSACTNGEGPWYGPDPGKSVLQALTDIGWDCPTTPLPITSNSAACDCGPDEDMIIVSFRRDNTMPNPMTDPYIYNNDDPTNDFHAVRLISRGADHNLDTWGVQPGQAFKKDSSWHHFKGFPENDTSFIPSSRIYCCCKCRK